MINVINNHTNVIMNIKRIIRKGFVIITAVLSIKGLTYVNGNNSVYAANKLSVESSQIIVSMGKTKEIKYEASSTVNVLVDKKNIVQADVSGDHISVKGIKKGSVVVKVICNKKCVKINVRVNKKMVCWKHIKDKLDFKKMNDISLCSDKD